MSFQVTPVPHNFEIPQTIQAAKEESKLVVFIGAGFPRLFGCWGWEKLAIGFVKKCHEAEIMNARERANIINKINRKEEKPIDIISVFFKKLIENHFITEIINLLKESCHVDPQVSDDLREAYSELKRLGDFYITANYDQHFDEFFGKENIVYKSDELYNLGGKDTTLSEDKLYHIHGSLLDIKSIVLTHDNYMERYSNPMYKNFLRKIFCNYNVLFIGYGLDEPEITNILREVKKQGNSTSNFLLKKYFVNENDDYLFDRDKFNDCDVDVISYLGDENNFRELINIIKSWNREIKGMELETE